MNYIKKILLIIAAVVFVMASGVNTAFGTTPSPETSTSSETPSDTTTDEATASFTLLDLNSVGEDVIRLQMRLRQLGYFNYRATGMYYGMTQKAVKQFQEQNGLAADGQAGALTYTDLFTIDPIRKPLASSVVPEVGEQQMLVTTTVYGELSSWEEIDAIFPEGTTVTITDFKTGVSFKMKRTGGTNHADVESTDADNYDLFVDCFGGESNWGEKRSVLVTINGVQYAASLFGHPSGLDTIEGNSMDGHTQLYFNGSTSDVLGLADRYHQEKVLIAAGQST